MFYHILQREEPVISCDIDLETYFMGGEEVTQDEIILVLANAFDNEQTRQDINDDLSCYRDEQERSGMTEKEIKNSWPNKQQKLWA